MVALMVAYGNELLPTYLTCVIVKSLDVVAYDHVFVISSLQRQASGMRAEGSDQYRVNIYPALSYFISVISKLKCFTVMNLDVVAYDYVFVTSVRQNANRVL